MLLLLLLACTEWKTQIHPLAMTIFAQLSLASAKSFKCGNQSSPQLDDFGSNVAIVLSRRRRTWKPSPPLPGLGILKSLANEIYWLLLAIELLNQDDINCLLHSYYIHQEGSCCVRLAKDRWGRQNFFNFSNRCWHWSSHMNVADFFNRLIIGLIFSANRGRNWDIVISLPTSSWTFFTFFGLLISITAWNFFGLASIPWCVNIKPTFFPGRCPNTISMSL